jgi:hypothetical protein
LESRLSCTTDVGRPVIERPDGTWRAIEKGVAVQPSQVNYRLRHDCGPKLIVGILVFHKGLQGLYSARHRRHAPSSQLLRARGAQSLRHGHVCECFILTPESIDPQNEFKPDVVEWGQKGFLQCSRILDQAKGPVAETTAEGPPDDLDIGPSRPAIKPVRSGGDLEELNEVGSPLSDLPEIEGRELKKAKVEAADMTLEDYEAMLDAEDGEGGYMEAGDIPEAEKQVS